MYYIYFNCSPELQMCMDPLSPAFCLMRFIVGREKGMPSVSTAAVTASYCNIEVLGLTCLAPMTIPVLTKHVIIINITLWDSQISFYQ